MFNISKFIIAAVAILFFQISTLGYVQAHERHSEFMMDRNNTKHNYNSTYVTYKTNPYHYNIAGNASRTCGKGYNPMSKQHRRNHRYKRPHVHPNVPWRPGCKD
ncbi:MAG: hypothetical protein DHS20C07_30320 [Methyloligella sp.]|jgi:hypothetical protein|nr:MAG: hypothetical protein DHS20C07_30320 [Methyloligella sp.]